MNSYTTFLKTSWCWNLGTFLSLGIAGLLLRAIRCDALAATPGFLVTISKTDIAVGAEHIFAGIGVPAGIAFMFILIIWFGEKNPRRSFPLGVNALLFGFVLSFSALAYSFHMWQHEIKQATVAVYSGPARGYLQDWQLIAGSVGIAIFWITNFFHWTTRGTTSHST